MKRKILFIIILTLLFPATLFADNNNISIYIYGEKVSFTNTPVIIKDRTFVPLRAIFEYLGAQIEWNDITKTVKAKRGNTEITLTIGSTVAYINGNSTNLTDEPQILNGSTYVPLRFVSESFKQEIVWDELNKIIKIGKELQPKDISDIVSPAVVYIEIHDKKGTATKSGSGFVVDKSGIVVTNFHVIDNGSKAIIKLIDGRNFETSTVLGYDKDRDIAVLKIDANNLPTVTLGDSDKVDNGERVITIGSPLGFDNSIADGLVSNNSRIIDNLQYIQTSAAISHGSSGGVLVDEKNAKVIGITTLTFGSIGENINMAIPINEYKKLYVSRNLTLDEVYQNTHIVNFANGDYYEGDIKKGLFDGIGFYHWKAEGNDYYGDWIKHKRIGKGLFTWANGNEYYGDFINDGVHTGKGIFTWKNGDKYTGDFVNGYFEGIGSLKLINGFTYDGDYKNGYRTGYGKSTWTNGDVYIGAWKDNERTGYGTYYFANGQILKGNFLNGQFIN